MLPQPKKRWTPEHWATWKPFGIGEQYPNNYWEVFRAIWENRDQLPYAWDILNQGVCDGCALGTTGMKDWTLEGIHVCNVRLRLLRMNTMPALTNNIDNAARICHSPSTAGLKNALGVAATTCSYKDWIGTDLLVFIGSNVANNQPVTVKYLHWAKKAGTKIVVINTYQEPGMERYWVPSIPESALFGTKFAEDFFLVNMGGDMAFINGTLKHLIANNWVDHSFINTYTRNFEDLKASLDCQSWEELERLSGASRDQMYEFAQMIAEANKAVFVWSMGITQHECGEDNVRSLINLALTKGFVGREGCGLMPIRGHSGVQGGAEMGCYATVLPGGKPITRENAAQLSKKWGFDVPTSPGLTASEMIQAAYAGELDVLFSVGGNFLEVLPEPDYVETALKRVPLRVHQDIICSSQMLVDPADTVILLPATTRYEVPGGVTETTTERRVIFSPEVQGNRIGEARPEWEVFMELARRVRPDLAAGNDGNAPLKFEGTAAIRQEIAQIIPQYAGIQHLKEAGDQFQYGGSQVTCDRARIRWRRKNPWRFASSLPRKP
ncbi:MAG: molybdopterin-dependent oxidoreductase [Coleofasciculus sp. D1-CHI-01]